MTSAPQTQPSPALLRYADYLQLSSLLDIQRPLAVPPAHDELMFIVVHQAYELWFRLLLHELTAARDAMLHGAAERAVTLLERCHRVERLMLAQVDVLDSLSPAGFREFRSALGTASGFESAQFREIEFLSGWKEIRYLAPVSGRAVAERAALRRRYAEPSLWDAFLAALTVAGHDVSEPGPRTQVLLRLARSEPSGLWRLGEALLDHDQAWTLWRGRHVLLVERQIGAAPGTGGSSGAAYLRPRRDRHFFPELWDVRSLL